ncbi:MAG: TIGR01841 family phasin, partial [Rhodospirillaceae bacterium]
MATTPTKTTRSRSTKSKAASAAPAPVAVGAPALGDFSAPLKDMGLPTVEQVVTAGQTGIDDAVKVSTEVFETGKGVVESMVKAGQTAAEESYEKAVNFSKEQVAAVEKASGDVQAKMDELVTEAKANAEALSEASSIYVQTLQDMAVVAYNFGRDSAEEGAALVKSLMEVKDPTAAYELQAAYSTKATEKAIEVSTQLTDMASKAAEAATAPVKARFDAAMGTMESMMT